MKKSIMLMSGMLILASAAAQPLRGEKISKGFPTWVADYESLALHGAGAPINWDAFTDASLGTAGRRVVPTGYPVMLTAGKIVPADGSSETLILMSAAVEGSQTDSISGYGLVTGGNVYEAQLPTATGTPRQLPAAVRSAASARIRFQ